MYEMLTGKVPFQGTTPAATMLKHLVEKPVPPSKLRAEIPPELERLVLRAMASDPAERYPSMAELEQELVVIFERIRRKSVASSNLKLPRPAAGGLKRWPIALGGGLAVLLLGLIVVITVMRKSPPPAPTPVAPPVKVSQPALVNWHIKSEPAGALVVRVTDGKVLGRTPFKKEMPLGEGTTDVELRLDGYHPTTLHLSNAIDEAPKRAHLQPIAPQKEKPVKKAKSKKRENGIRDNDDIKVIN
jgi:hypothetical protein